jgi:hypothetical protein
MTLNDNIIEGIDYLPQTIKYFITNKIIINKNI